MRIGLDTNIYSDFQMGRLQSLVEEIYNADFIVLPFIVDAELRAGFKKGQNEEGNIAKLKKFKSMDRVEVILPDEQTTEYYAKIWSDLSRKGKPIPTNDVWIAAICLQHNLVLATRDAHFKSVTYLQILSP